MWSVALQDDTSDSGFSNMLTNAGDLPKQNDHITQKAFPIQQYYS